MKLLGFNFTKIHVEKSKDKIEGLKINSRIDVVEIVEAKTGIIKTKEEILAIKFIYGLDYEPGIGKIDLAGNLVLSVEPKKAKEVLKQWENKNMPEDFRSAIFNLILRKSSLKALQLEEELNLPIHMQLPTLKIQEKKE